MPCRKFTYPFCYTPSPQICEAAAELVAGLEARRSQGDPVACALAQGKMLGVMQVGMEDGNEGFIYAFSGLICGRASADGFVPPIFDYSLPPEGNSTADAEPGENKDATARKGYFRQREAEISAMPSGEAKSRASAELQDWLFTQYRVSNALGESASIKEVFARRGMVPPGGTGDCAAPRLLQHAYDNGLKPIAMGEFWYGASPAKEVRRQGCFYPSCTGKCGPLLSFMMQGLDVEDNPLDREFTADREPRIIWSDGSIIIADKPAGMLSVPGRTSAVSLLEWLRERFGDSVESCHRLDMDTSGIMVFARNASAKSFIEGQFANRKVTKTYRARLCAGDRPFGHAPKGTIALPLSPDWYDRPRQMVDFEGGKTAVTGYEVLRTFPDGEIEIRFTPKTGRTHQIRVHAAHELGLGRPIKGDRLYGNPGTGRLFLMAESISFIHPDTKEPVYFEIPAPFE